jgi:hypothetical protein
MYGLTYLAQGETLYLSMCTKEGFRCVDSLRANASALWRRTGRYYAIDTVETRCEDGRLAWVGLQVTRLY